MNLSIFSFDYLRDIHSAVLSRKWRVAVVFLLLLVILLFCMRVLWTVFFFENFQVQAVQSLNVETKTIGIGSSRMFYGIDPRKMPEGYVSLAADYLDMSGAERIYSKFSDDLPKLQLVFLELSVSTLFYDMSALAPQALQPLGLDILPKTKDFFSRPDHAIRLLLSPLFRWRLTPEFVASHGETRHDLDEPMDAVPGFIPSNLKLTQPQLFAERKVAQTREHLERFGPKVFDRNLEAVTRLVVTLNQRGIKTVFLRFPIDRHVWPVFDNKWNDKVQDVFLEIKSSVKDVTFVDLSHSPDFLSEDFRDPDHLNAKGAERFTGLIAPIARAELGY